MCGIGQGAVHFRAGPLPFLVVGAKKARLHGADPVINKVLLLSG